MIWHSYTSPRRIFGGGFTYVATDIGDVAEGGWVSPFDKTEAEVREALREDLARISAEILAEEAWSRVEDHIDRQLAVNFPGGRKKAAKPTKHVCAPPPTDTEDEFPRTWDCECGQKWRKPPWYRAYMPVNE